MSKSSNRYPRLIQLFVRTGQKWANDQCLEMGASISYYAIFSFFPIIIVMLSIAGFLLGPDAQLSEQVLTYARQSLPEVAYETVARTMVDLNESSLGAGIVGFLLLLVAASNVFSALKRSFNTIWKASNYQQVSTSLWDTVSSFIRTRLLSLLLVISASALMVLSLLSNIAIETIRTLLNRFNELITFVNLDEVAILKNIQVGATFFILFLIVLVLFKILPSTIVRWGDIWLGSLLTTSLLVLLQGLASNSVIRIGSQFRSYGIIGGVMVLLLWLYWTCQIFFIGGEFSYVYSYLFGSRRSPIDKRRRRK